MSCIMAACAGAKSAQRWFCSRTLAAPPHSGVTTFLARHPFLNWLDHSRLLEQNTARDGKQGCGVTADRLIIKHRCRGYNVFVSSWQSPALVDGFVLIDENTLRKRLNPEEFMFNQLHAEICLDVARKYGIPIFTSFEEGIRCV